MRNQEQIPDQQAREAAETTFDRNVVVVAGAGTGKTTLLVNRLIHLLMKEPRPLPITQIVALTFTNKAATEMKIRLRERLSALANPDTDARQSTDGGAVAAADLQPRYGLDALEIAARAVAALRDLEKAQIGTLHSFAAHLLRLHPLESGLDPAFQEDDGLRFDEHFTAAWDVWIDHELGREGTHHPEWRTILTSTTLEELRDLTYALCSELVDIDAISQQLQTQHRNPALVTWLRQLGSRAQVLLQAHDRSKRRKVEQMLAAIVELTTLVAERGAGASHELTHDARDWLGKDLGGPVEGWEKSDFSEAARAIKTAQQLLSVDQPYFINLFSILSPLIRSIRASFSAKGWLSFDGLLAHARRLLWDHPAVRARIKQDYRGVLVDEFQDTDPVQYDIILAVSERQENHASSWEKIALEPGKLFIVGDPKQSIYAFRRADIEAFDRVVQKIEADGGIIRKLTTNFRSDAAILGPVNDLFDRLFEPRPLVQPANVRLEERPRRRPAFLDPGVRLRITAPKDEEEGFDSEAAARAEGESVARWLKEEVLTRHHVKAGHVALLFRKLTQADAYVDALRRYGIPYVIEGEKHFYRRQEVIDLINLLRVLDHPQDRIALAAVLRSPLGGFTDRDLYDLHQAGLLNYLIENRLDAWSHPRVAAVRRLYGQLARLSREIAVFPLAEAVQVVFDRLPILELAAASLHGEQAVANLLKVKQTAATLSDRPHLTLSRFVDLMVTRLDVQPDEAESPLAEESSDAVQVLTIHKAKGLEFPVVVLPGLHQGSGRDRSTPGVVYDWSSGTYGLSLGEHRTLGSVLIHEKVAVREEAERRRVLYVGMTRAKDLLLLSGSVTERAVGENVLDLLQDAGEGEIGSAATEQLKIGPSAIPHQVVLAPDRKWTRRSLTEAATSSSPDPALIARLWNDRTARWNASRAIDWRVAPTTMSPESKPARGRATESGRDGDIGRLTGILAHRILERWDFTASPDRLPDQIAPALHTLSKPEQEAFGSVVADSLREIFRTFGRSDAYARLRSGAMVAREIPFAMPWEEGRMVEGVIDVIYRLDGRLWIADYKTDRVSAEEAPARALHYAAQATIYRRAVERGSVEPVGGFQIMFLRPGITVDM